MALRLLVCALGLVVTGTALLADTLFATTPGIGLAQIALLILAAGLFASVWLPFEWRARVALVAAAGMLAVLVAELGLRVGLHRTFSETLEADPDLIYRLRAGSSRYFQREMVDGGERVLVQVNRDGFRGDPLATGTNHPRVIVYGDSFIEAEFSAWHRTFTEQLERVLSTAHGGAVEVVNAGVSGYGPDQHLLRAPADLARLQPALVIVVLYAGNDYGDLLRNKLVQIDSVGQLCTHSPRTSHGVRQTLTAMRRRPYLMRALQRVRLALEARQAGVASGSHIARHRVTEALQFNRSDYQGFVVQGDLLVRDIGNDPEDVDIAIDPEAPSARYKIVLMARVLDEIIETARAAGVPLVFVIVPPGMDVVDRYQLIHIDSTEFPGYRRDRLSATLDSLLKERGADLVNLYAPYVSQGAAQFYFRGNDSHWNDHGQHVAAEIVGAHLVRQGFPPQPAQPSGRRHLAGCPATTR